MLALGTSQALEGSATSATTVTYTISGLEMDNSSPPNEVGYSVLAQGQLAASAGSMYNPGGSNTALISSIHLLNTNGTTSQTIALYIEGTAGANQIVSLVIPAGGYATYEDGDAWTVYTSSGLIVTGSNITFVATYIGTTVAIGATTTVNITSLALPVGTFHIIGTVLAKLTTATLGHMDAWIGPTSASKTGAYVAGTASMGNIAGGTEEDTIQLDTGITLTTPTTVYLEAYASEATTAESATTEQTIGNCTGILAFKLN
jgi:hypothetical protein